MASLSAYDRIGTMEAQMLGLQDAVRKQANELEILRAQLSAIMPYVPRRRQPLPFHPDDMVHPLSEMAEIAMRVAAQNLLTLHEIRGPSRKKHVSWPRQDAMREMLDAGFSTTQVGRFFQRDHTTVISGARASRMRGGA